MGGLALGLAGVLFVVRHKVSFSGDAAGLVPSAVALVGISVGTLYQKRFCAHVDLRSGSVVQFTACALLFAPLVLALRAASPSAGRSRSSSRSDGRCSCCRWARSACCYWLLRHGASAEVARLFYLVPPVTALMAYRALRRDARCAGDRGHGADRRGRGARAAGRGLAATGAASSTTRVPATRSCRNWRSRSMSAHSEVERDEPRRMRAVARALRAAR